MVPPATPTCTRPSTPSVALATGAADEVYGDWQEIGERAGLVRERAGAARVRRERRRCAARGARAVGAFTEDEALALMTADGDALEAPAVRR